MARKSASLYVNIDPDPLDKGSELERLTQRIVEPFQAILSWLLRTLPFQVQFALD